MVAPTIGKASRLLPDSFHRIHKTHLFVQHPKQQQDNNLHSLGFLDCHPLFSYQNIAKKLRDVKKKRAHSKITLSNSSASSATAAAASSSSSSSSTQDLAADDYDAADDAEITLAKEQYARCKIDKYPVSITIPSKLPQFNAKLMDIVLKRQFETGCIWKPEVNDAMSSKYHFILSKMNDKKLCLFANLERDVWLTLFPISLFRTLKPKSWEPTLGSENDNFFLSFVVDGECFKRFNRETPSAAAQTMRRLRRAANQQANNNNNNYSNNNIGSSSTLELQPQAVNAELVAQLPEVPPEEMNIPTDMQQVVNQSQGDSEMQEPAVQQQELDLVQYIIQHIQPMPMEEFIKRREQMKREQYNSNNFYLLHSKLVANDANHLRVYINNGVVLQPVVITPNDKQPLREQVLREFNQSCAIQKGEFIRYDDEPIPDTDLEADGVCLELDDDFYRIGDYSVVSRAAVAQ